MVGRYTRKTNRQFWNEQAMQEAIRATEEKRMGWLKAAKVYNVPQATLRRRAKNKNKRATGVKKILGRYESTFDSDTEKELVNHIKLLESRLFGLTTIEVRQLAYTFAQQNNIKHRFSHASKIAGKEWLRGFRKRNPEIALRQPEPTSAARAMAFNKPQVNIFFEKLEVIIKENGIEPDRLYNMDESGLSTVQKPPKIMAATGRKQVGSLTSAERGQHVTSICCMNAVGNFIPPALIFPRKNRKDELLDKAPPGTLGLYQESGWISIELFVKWLQHFSKHVKPSNETKVLLLLDGHISHKSLEAVTFAKANGIIMMCFPAHCTHRMQPLDVSFFGPLKTYYNQDCSIWLKNHPGRVITDYQIAELFAAAYGKAATVKNASSGFANTGIYPFNSNIFPDHLFLPSDTTDMDRSPNNQLQEINLEDLQHTQNEDSAEVIPKGGSQVDILEKKEIIEKGVEPEIRKKLEKDKKSNEIRIEMCTAGPSNIGKKVTFEEISPLPKALNLTRKRKTNLNKYSVLTSSPNIEELKEKVEKKLKIEEARKAKRDVFKITTGNIEKKARKVNYSELEEEEEGIRDPFYDDDDENEVACLYCNDIYKNSRSNEKWLQCMTCLRWAHLDCTGLSPKAKLYVCELCS